MFKNLFAKKAEAPPKRHRVLSISETKALPAEVMEALRMGQQVQGDRYSLMMDRHSRVIVTYSTQTTPTSPKMLESSP